ncbi:MAG TPA: hypothetical protein VGD71_04230 [Kribbella sp.]|jgi:hypothetical protein
MIRDHLPEVRTVLTSRALALSAGLALVVVTAAGCGGGHARKTPTSPPASAARTSATPTPVSYAAQHVKSSLLTAHEVDTRTHAAPVTLLGFGKAKVPSCADTSITLPAGPDTTAHEFDPSDSRSSVAAFVELAAVYRDAASAASAFAHVKSKVSACPDKQHVGSKKASGKQFMLAYDDSWKTTADEVSGWTHVRGFEKLTYSASASIINIIYEVHDYAAHGNAVISTVYLKRVKPSAAEGPIAKQASALLTRQLAKIG